MPTERKAKAPSDTSGRRDNENYAEGGSASRTAVAWWTLPLANREWRQRKLTAMDAYWRLAPAVALVAGLFFGLIGPFGGYDRWDLWSRLNTWVLIVAAGTLVFGAVRAMHDVFRLDTVGGFMATLITGSIPLSVIVGWLTAQPLGTLSLSQWPIKYVNTALISTICLGAVQLVISLRRQPEYVEGPGSISVVSEPQATLPSPLHQRLPATAREARILALRTDDHYVHVYTDRGSHMILLRFKDALRELEPLDGAQIHRSWWVAREAVDGVEREGDRYQLKLVNGETAPVARRRVTTLRSEGWLDLRATPAERRRAD